MKKKTKYLTFSKYIALGPHVLKLPMKLELLFPINPPQVFLIGLAPSSFSLSILIYVAQYKANYEFLYLIILGSEIMYM